MHGYILPTSYIYIYIYIWPLNTTSILDPSSLPASSWKITLITVMLVMKGVWGAVRAGGFPLWLIRIILGIYMICYHGRIMTWKTQGSEWMSFFPLSSKPIYRKWPLWYLSGPLILIKIFLSDLLLKTYLSDLVGRPNYQKVTRNVLALIFFLKILEPFEIFTGKMKNLTHRIPTTAFLASKWFLFGEGLSMISDWLAGASSWVDWNRQNEITFWEMMGIKLQKQTKTIRIDPWLPPEVRDFPHCRNRPGQIRTPFSPLKTRENPPAASPPIQPPHLLFCSLTPCKRRTAWKHQSCSLSRWSGDEWSLILIHRFLQPIYLDSKDSWKSNQCHTFSEVRTGKKKRSNKNVLKPLRHIIYSDLYGHFIANRKLKLLRVSSYESSPDSDCWLHMF